MLNKSDYEILFINLTNLYDYQQIIFEITENLHKNGLVEKTLQTLLNILPGLKIYREYCQKYENSNKKLKELFNNESSFFKNSKFA
jgi:hypothetical protein